MLTWNLDGAEELIARGANPNMAFTIRDDDGVHRVSLLYHVVATSESIDRRGAVRILMDAGANPYALHGATGLTSVEEALNGYLSSYNQSKVHQALEYRDVVFTLMRYSIDPKLMSDRGLLLLTAPIDTYDLPLIEEAIGLDHHEDVIKSVIDRVQSKTHGDERPRDKDLLLKMLNSRLQELEDSDE